MAALEVASQADPEQYYASVHADFHAMGCEGAALEVLKQGLAVHPSSESLRALAHTAGIEVPEVPKADTQQQPFVPLPSLAKAFATQLPSPPPASGHAASDTPPAFAEKSYWDERFAKEEHYEWISDYSKLRQFIVKACPNKTDRILNLGCGTSRICEEMYDDGFINIVNVDISEVAVEKMRARNKQLRPTMEWHTADATDLALFSEGSIDAVLDKSTLDAISCDQQSLPLVKMLGEVTRVLKTGGVYCLVTLDPTNLDFLKMPHLAYDLDVYLLSTPGFPGMGLLSNSNHRVCICRKRIEAEGQLLAKLPMMVEWATRFDQWQRFLPAQSAHGTPEVQQLLAILAADTCTISNGVPRYGERGYWDKRFSDEDHFEWISDYAGLRELIAKACPNKGARILHLGCGSSRLGEDLYDDGYKDIMNVDICETAVEKMRRRNDQQRPDMRWKVADAADLACFSDKSFDLVVDKGTLDTVACMRKNLLVARMLAEVTRVLDEGGTYLLVTLDATNPGFLKMPHLAYTVEDVPLGGPCGLGYFMKHSACLCKRRPEADRLLREEGPRALERAAKLDEEEGLRTAASAGGR